MYQNEKVWSLSDNSCVMHAGVFHSARTWLYTVDKTQCSWHWTLLHSCEQTSTRRGSVQFKSRRQGRIQEQQKHIGAERSVQSRQLEKNRHEDTHSTQLQQTFNWCANWEKTQSGEACRVFGVLTDGCVVDSCRGKTTTTDVCTPLHAMSPSLATMARKCGPIQQVLAVRGEPLRMPQFCTRRQSSSCPSTMHKHQGTFQTWRSFQKGTGCTHHNKNCKEGYQRARSDHQGLPRFLLSHNTLLGCHSPSTASERHSMQWQQASR